MVQSYKAFIFASTALVSSYSVYAEEFRSQRTPTELASFFPGSVELIPLKNQKYPSLPEDVQEELAFIADQMLSPAHACELYNTLTKTTQIHWCLAADYDSYADRSATRYNLSHHDVKIYNAHDFLELAVSVYDVPSLSTLHVEVQNSLGTITIGKTPGTIPKRLYFSRICSVFTNRWIIPSTSHSCVPHCNSYYKTLAKR